MDDDATVTLRALIASNVSRLREDSGVPAERVAQAAEAVGLTWTVAWVEAMEHGQKALGAEQLVALPIVLSAALGHRVTLADLLAGDEPVVLGKGEGHAPIENAYLREVVTGSTFKRPFPEVGQDATALLLASNAAVQEKLRTIREANLDDVDVRTLGRAEAGSGAAEAKLARRLDVAEIVVVGAAASLWGRSLSDERDARLRDDPTLSATAVNRTLVAEVTRRLTTAAEAGSRPGQTHNLPRQPERSRRRARDTGASARYG